MKSNLIGSSRVTASVLDIAPISVGKVLRPLSPDGDLLGEMVEEQA